MEEVSPLSPEARRKTLGAAYRKTRVRLSELRADQRVWEVAKRVAVGTFNDGFIHAGNLAFLSLLTLFPFFIVIAALAGLLGRTADGQQAVGIFLQTVPPSVAEVVRQPIADVLMARTGPLLWLGGAVGLWSTGSFIETIRDILRRAYGTKQTRAFYEYRLMSTGIIVASVLLALIAFAAQVVLTGAEQFIYRLVPIAGQTANLISLSKLLPAAALFGALYIIFYTLTPSLYRGKGYPKWPGAVLVAVWWIATTALLPRVLSLLGSYDRTYGSLAGVIVALLFFFIIGLGVVVGAQLNAALAEASDQTLRQASASEKEQV